ncbi:caspase-1-like isoform X2 [Daphnia carinata]|uniref:caspase-1-like isoform X2 n=1 Tax=Daphnia carinata TaxID=120202 RepID=UPI00257AFB0F|nr:caspase-1-like isoform X2 [Daphnia carinata]
MSSNDFVDAQPVPPVEASILNQATNATSSATQSQHQDCVDYPITIVPVDKDTRCYDMNHKRRGDAYIFHHTEFDLNLQLDKRENDGDLLKRLSNVLDDRLEFTVKVFTNLKYKKICKEITKAANANHQNSDCILFVFMTHGFNDKLYARDTHYNLDPLRLLFTAEKCRTLAGKPKIFIVQACRGDSVDGGTLIPLRANRSISASAMDGPNIPYKLSTHADFLIAYATVSNYGAYRTWFLESLCNVLDSEENQEDDFLSMMTTVQRKVAISFESELGEKQIPSLTSLLTRKIYFTRKKKPRNSLTNRMSCINSNVSE